MMLGLKGRDELFKPHPTYKMKKLIIAASLLLGFALVQPATAQVSVNINIGSQPVWGPVGYDYVEYYYFPDLDMYYHVPTQEYVYLVNGRWVFSRILPPYYSNYDFYRGYKVVINDPRPYLYHDRYRANYAQYRGRIGQPVIRDSRDSRYYGNPGHPQYNRQIYANRNQNQPRYENQNQLRYQNQNQLRGQYSDRNEPDYRQQNNRVETRGNRRAENQNNNNNRSRSSEQNTRSQSNNRNSRGRN